MNRKEMDFNTTRVFVYGTLKEGYYNHRVISPYAEEMKPAKLCGRIYDLSAGFPALEIPQEHELAPGAGESAADAALLYEQSVIHGCAALLPQAEGDWDTVYGELYVLREPEESLAAADYLEGFRAEGSGLYRRVAALCETEEGIVTAWVYVMDGIMEKRGKRIKNGVWEAKS